MASMMGAIAFQKGLGVTHSLAHPLSTLAGMHHGLANGIMLVTAMRFNLEVSRERLTEICRVIYGAIGRDHEKPTAEGAVAYFEELCRSVGIPKRLSEAGVSKDLVSALSEQAVHDTCWLSNPRPVTRQDFERMYSETM